MQAVGFRLEDTQYMIEVNANMTAVHDCCPVSRITLCVPVLVGA